MVGTLFSEDWINTQVEEYLAKLEENMNAVDPARRGRTDLIVGYDVAVKEMLKFLEDLPSEEEKA